jgi:peptidoglycan/xylan/chitin deacetylase (PgdA/CDA1 family)
MKKLSITFDNGPDPECTPEVLDVLGERGVKATFFVCGQGNRLHPALKARTDAGRKLLERARDERHWIGNHTLTHSVELGTTNDPEVIEREIGGNQEILGDLNGQRLFRPYMGGGIFCKRTFSPAAIRYLCDEGYTTVMFNCLPRDWENPEGWPELALQQMEARDWSLLIVHDVARYGSMKQLARFLDRAIENGVEIVQDFPADCVPIRDGRIVGSLDGIVCGDVPEAPHPLSAAAAAALE